MTENKKPLFDEVDFGEAWETMSAKRMRIFIRKYIRKAQREAVMEVLDEIQPILVGPLHRCSKIHCDRDIRTKFYRIRAKYQGGKEC